MYIKSIIRPYSQQLKLENLHVTVLPRVIGMSFCLFLDTFWNVFEFHIVNTRYILQRILSLCDYSFRDV